MAKLAFVNATPIGRGLPPEERHRPLLDPVKLDAARIATVEKLRLFEETKTIGVGGATWIQPSAPFPMLSIRRPLFVRSRSYAKK